MFGIDEKCLCFLGNGRKVDGGCSL
jgi:hypothetical protein